MDTYRLGNVEGKSYYIVTFGCQMNNHDSERIAGVLNECGYGAALQMSDASLILINTCNVRPKAVHKAFSQLGRVRELKRKNPDLIVGVCGCLPQTDREKIFHQAPEVDIVFGTQNIYQLPVLLERLKLLGKRQIEIVSAREGLPVGRHRIVREDSVRAWVTIMEGCDNFCSYCVVPFTRGREASFPPDKIYSEVEELAGKGYKEVVLLGQNVNSYGLKESFSTDFPSLLRMLHPIGGLERIRFVTSHPKDFSGSLIDVMASSDKVCSQVHLPVQSGSDKVLSLMKRKYTREEYIDKISMLRQKVGDVAVTTDIIVGFPGETEEDFADTMSLLEKMRFDGVFSFKYSDRPRTKASEMTNKVDPVTMHERFERLVKVQNRISLEKNLEDVAKTFEVLVEGTSKSNPDFLCGRTDKNKIVHFRGDGFDKGDMVRIFITEGKSHCLIGEPVGI